MGVITADIAEVEPPQRTSPRHLLHIFPTFAVGGSQARFVELAAAHGERYRHTILALDGVTDMLARVAQGVALKSARVEYKKTAGLLNLPLFRQWLARQSADLLVTYNWGSIEWALANRFKPIAPHIHIEDGFGPEERHRQLPRRVLMRRVALSGRHTVVVAPSRTLERVMLLRWRLSPHRTRHIANGIDCDRFERAVPDRRDRTGPVVIGTLATLRPEKNLARLIMAFAATAAALRPRSLELVIAGDGAERPFLENVAVASGAGDRIRFLGATSAPESVLADFDVFALSSDTEQMPLSVLEAMASGLPVVALDVGDIAEMVDTTNRRFIVPLTAEADYREALATLIANPALRHEIGSANRQRARLCFSRNAMAASYAELFG